MNTQLPNSSSQRGPILMAVAAGLILVGIAAYFFMDNAPASAPINGPKMVAAINAYSRKLVQTHAPVPPAVPLQDLVDKGYLQPNDIGALQGADAKVYLTAATNGLAVLMQVHLTDGTDLVLLEDGSVRQAVKR